MIIILVLIDELRRFIIQYDILYKLVKPPCHATYGRGCSNMFLPILIVDL
jgi:hypothetical protein